ncbi:MAG: amidohydrolase [Ruminococcaceae bacterium]|nr:amidohydrolase [Oscillospiraceae bacterium]
MKISVLKEAEKIQNYLVDIRRKLHASAELGFELHKTTEIVKNELISMGITPTDCGRQGIIAFIGREESEEIILLRADMDALEITEETGLSYASENGCMHACGHDMHTAMLIGAAKILKTHENELSCGVKLMFQPAEEILLGAEDMINNGVLSSPNVTMAVMIHTMTGIPYKTGSLIVSPKGVSAPSADYFEVYVKGVSAHGSSPHLGVNALTAASQIVLNLPLICSQEIGMTDRAVLAVCALSSGSANNIIPDRAVIKGNMRTFDERLREYIKNRIVEVSENAAKLYRGEAKVKLSAGCPTLINDSNIVDMTDQILHHEFSDKMIPHDQLNKSGGASVAGSEDFAYISHKVPSVMIAVAAGNSTEGYIHSLHNPKTMFDERALSVGAAVYASIPFGINED